MIKHLNKDGYLLPYKVISKDNKNTYIRFKVDHIEVSKSKHISNLEVEKLLIANFNKYYNKYQALLKTTPDSDEIMLEDKIYRLKIVKQRKFDYLIKDNELIVYTTKSKIKDIKDQIYKEYLLKMIQNIKPIYSKVLKLNNIKEVPIKIGYFKSKFGSYHRLTNEIKLNIVLAKTNIRYLYYVIMHEYAHTKVFNHSKDFYNLLGILMPEYKYYDKSIKKLSIWL